MIDCGFPVIRYSPGDSYLQRGQHHGEQWREAIAELVTIRRDMMHEKNPHLTDEMIDQLAQEQWDATQHYDQSLGEELQGLCDGAGVTRTDMVILNNYTDFRDIHLADQGCSSVFVTHDGQPVVGQTWDMHGSAKRFLCCMEVPCPGFDLPKVMYSLVGCLGMMGFHPAGHMIGVNNIVTYGARAGAVWPAVVRRSLAQPDHASMERELVNAPVTSGHAYLLASPAAGQFWEIMPDLVEPLERLDTDRDGYLFHTNHCLGPSARYREVRVGRKSTTHIRYRLLKKKIVSVRSFDEVYALLNDHENYPKSIFSNYQADSKDPSITCGGAIGDLMQGKIRMWRGDELYDENFVSREFNMGVPEIA